MSICKAKPSLLDNVLGAVAEPCSESGSIEFFPSNAFLLLIHVRNNTANDSIRWDFSTQLGQLRSAAARRTAGTRLARGAHVLTSKFGCRHQLQV